VIYKGEQIVKEIPMEDLVLAANTIRMLAADGVQKAKSGHPGLPMGMADVAAVLYLKHIVHQPSDPAWANRDRFVLSGGHGAMLIYSLLHLSGYDLPIDQLMQFRQWESKTPGHPEYAHTPGVETTTGPLGQGIGNAVGMALAERMLAERFNMEDSKPVDHYTYVFCGDGDLMEGISHEACSLAGHLGLNKLIMFYDSNSITIEGATSLACSDDVKKRFQGYQWNVIEIDGHDTDQIDKAIRKARREKARPTIIVCTTTIAKGSPNKAGTAAAHGEPLGDDEVKASKKNLGFAEDQSFVVPDKVKALFAERREELGKLRKKWDKVFRQYAFKYTERAQAWEAHQKQALPDNLEALLPVFPVDKPLATRIASGKVIQELAKAFPWFVGGSADLAPSTKTFIDGSPSIAPNAFCGSNFHFGIREHGMGSILNGITLHGGFRVFGATFYVFSDYCRPTIRLAAIMKLPVIYVFTHDSFYVGEDGPTHEPVEHTAALRCMPNLTILRPADATETGAAWLAALKNKQGPTAILLTRQNLNILDRSKFPSATNLEKGAYILWENKPGTAPEIVLIGTGSEVELAIQSAKVLADQYAVRVVSMPSWELFEQQTDAYRASVIPVQAKLKVALEAGSPQGWDKYVGTDGLKICMNRFGASAPYKVLAEKFGFTVDNVISQVKQRLG
jgi:transketolase